MPSTGAFLGDGPIQGARFERFRRRCDLPLGLVALAIVPVLILEDRATEETLRGLAYAANWAIWLAFCAEFATKLVLARKRVEFIRAAWLDVAVIVLSPPFLVPDSMEGIRALRAVRLLRLLRLFRVSGYPLH
jgi:hypothetical protein